MTAASTTPTLGTGSYNRPLAYTAASDTSTNTGTASLPVTSTTAFDRQTTFAGTADRTVSTLFPDPGLFPGPGIYPGMRQTIFTGGGDR